MKIDLSSLWAKLRQPSSIAGIGLITLGLGEIGKVKEAPAIADAIANVGAAVSAGEANPWNLALIALGSLSVLLNEKGGK